MEMDYETVISRLDVKDQLTQDETDAITKRCAYLVLDGEWDKPMDIFAKTQKYHLMKLHKGLSRLMVSVANFTVLRGNGNDPSRSLDEFRQREIFAETINAHTFAIHAAFQILEK